MATVVCLGQNPSTTNSGGFSISWIIALNVLILGIISAAFYYWKEKIHKKLKNHLLQEIALATKKIESDKILLKNQANEILKMDKLKTRFFKNVSHELRTPLTLIMGPLKSIRKSNALEGKNLELLAHAERNASSLLNLVQSILDLSKLENGHFELHEEPQLIYPLIKRYASIFESKAQHLKKDIILNYQAEKQLCLLIDSKKLEIVINNLVANALKFTSSNHGKIEINIIDNINQIEIQVKDNGVGIHAEDLPFVFNRYFESNHKGTSQSGIKIGLALCKELVHLMGGRISVDSKIGEGTTFKIMLPKKEVLGAYEFDEENLTDNIQIDIFDALDYPIVEERLDKLEKKSTILLVEDNQALRSYLKSILHESYHIVGAENGQEALNLLNDKKGESIDLILSDIMMPIMDGYELLEKLKSDEHLCAIPVIMLTARAELQDKLKALRIGVDDYIYKPFDEDELFVRIKNLLLNYSERKQFLQTDRKIEKTINSVEDLAWLQTCEEYIFENISSDIFSVPMVAQHFHMSESTINRQIKKLTGLSTGKYIQEIKLNYARELLEKRTYNSISKVAYQIGFKDSKSFSRAFKNRFHKNPSEYLELI